MAAVFESLPSISNCTCAVFLLPKILREILRDHHAQQARALVDRLLDRMIIVHLRRDVEISRPAELPDQIAALRRLILIVNDSRDVVHVQAQRPSEDQQHDQRLQQRGQLDFADREGCAASLCGRSRVCGGNSCGGLLFFLDQTDENVFHRRHDRVQRLHLQCRRSRACRSISGIACPASSTFTCNPPPNTAMSRIPCCLSSAVMLPSKSDDSRFNRCPVAQRCLQLRGRSQRDDLARHTSARRDGSTRLRPCNAW